MHYKKACRAREVNEFRLCSPLPKLSCSFQPSGKLSSLANYFLFDGITYMLFIEHCKSFFFVDSDILNPVPHLQPLISSVTNKRFEKSLRMSSFKHIRDNTVLPCNSVFFYLPS